MNNPKQQLTINSIPLAAHADVCNIAINNEDGEVNLLFIQINPFASDQNSIIGTGIANVQMSIENLKRLKKTIENSIDNYEKQTN